CWIDRDQRGRQAPRSTLGSEEHPVLGHGGRHALEEGARQIRRRVVRAIGAAVAAVEKVPVDRLDARPLADRKTHAGGRDLATLLLDLLALVALQAGQEVSKVCIPLRLPAQTRESDRRAAPSAR